AAAGAKNRFTLKDAPHFGMYSNHAPGGPIDELKFMADQGFFALEDNGMMGRSVEEQERIAREMQRLGIEMGVFVASFGPNISSGSKDAREGFLKNIRSAVEVAKRVNAKWTTVVPGNLDQRIPMDFQMGYVIDALKAAAEIYEPHGLVMVLEPLNPWRDHPGLFLSTTGQGYAICKGVGSPACKILYDIYHQQITEGNLIPNINRAWDEIPYFQIGDNPGRNEPTTGEINYKNVFKHIHSRGFKGIMGMEHGKSQRGKEGEIALIRAYVESDDF
ncbi:MAG: TIM barrel protein, partial [Armatimonadetes bacterium]|nr:TIM barrel protein [Armatimonadota bacterium]